MTKDLRILYAVLLNVNGRVSKVEVKDNTYTFHLICPRIDSDLWMNIAIVRLIPNKAPARGTKWIGA